MEKKGIGVILEGGGVKGAYHVGALKAFEEAGFEFSGYAGTSIGALNAAQLCQTDLKTLTEIWENVVTTTIYDVDQELIDKYKESGFSLDFIKAALKKRKNFKEYYRGTQVNMYDFIHGHLVEEELRNSPKDLGFVTYCITDWKGVEMMKEETPIGSLVDFVEASAAFPAFPAKEIDGKKYIDGGAWDNCPINLFARNGYRKMVVIRTGTKDLKRDIERKDLKLLCVVPKAELGKTMEFDADIIERDIKLGYEDAKSIIDKQGILFER